MDNLSFENIAIGATIVGILNLIIVVLIKTENILIYIEKIKGILRINYRSRIKRADEEIKLLKKYNTIARERVKHQFIVMDKWDCTWSWNWSDDLDPINIKANCSGNISKTGNYTYYCSHPVQPAFLEIESQKDTNKITLGIYCTQNGEYPHEKFRASFDVWRSEVAGLSAEQAVENIITKAILTKRDLLIASETSKLRKQFWR